MHSDPVGIATRANLLRSLSPAQTAYLKREALDYGMPSNPEEEKHGMENAADSAIRGVVAKQWPKAAILGMKYTPQQSGMIDKLEKYMRTGTR